MKYEYLGRTKSRRFTVGGVNVFDLKWNTCGEVVTVFDPVNEKPYNFDVCYITTGNGNVYFVVGNDEKHDYVFVTYKED